MQRDKKHSFQNTETHFFDPSLGRNFVYLVHKLTRSSRLDVIVIHCGANRKESLDKKVAPSPYVRTRHVTAARDFMMLCDV